MTSTCQKYFELSGTANVRQLANGEIDITVDGEQDQGASLSIYSGTQEAFEISGRAKLPNQSERRIQAPRLQNQRH